MRKKILICFAAMGLCVGSVSAQFATGIVFDPTNYHNALLRYFQLQQQLIQLRNSYGELVSQYQLAVRMATNLRNMPARYRAQFSRWQNVSAQDNYGNTAGWVAAANSGEQQAVLLGYRQATTELGSYDQAYLSSMSADELARVKSQYASVELADGANASALRTIGSIRSNAQTLETQMGNLERDSLSEDPSLNSEVQVLNKINAGSVLTLRSIQDSNKLLASLVEQQVISAKQQREKTANAINTEINRRASVGANLTRVTGTLTDSLENFRMP